MQFCAVSEYLWEGKSVLLDQEYVVKLEIVEDNNSLEQEVIIMQKNVEDENMTYKLQGDLKDGVMYGRWQDETFKIDSYWAVLYVKN